MPIDPTSSTVPNTSADLTAELIQALRAQVPHVFSEAGVDLDKLKVALGENVLVGKERYGLTWAGKADAFRNVQTVSSGTLAPMPSESVNWDATENLIIEGDNLEVLKLLQRPYHGQVKMIYIDPPYNTGNEFIYPDNFREGLADYLRFSGQVDEAGFAQSANKDTSGRYHSNWLNMMYPRLFLARNLLREDGVIFVSIDDHEVHNLRHLMDEVFGEENFVASLVWQKRTSPDARLQLSDAHEYLLCFARQLDNLALTKVTQTPKQLANYKNPDNDQRGDWASTDFTAQGYRPNQMYEITTPSGRLVTPPPGSCWKNTEETFLQLVADNRIWFGKSGDGVPRRKTFLSESEGVSVWTWWGNADAGHTQEAKQELKDLMPDSIAVFDTPKPVRLIARCAQIATESEDIILDFFAGSGTTAQAVLELNAKDGGHRKFILVQLPEKTDNPKFPTIADITRERVRRVIAKLDGVDLEKLGTPNQASLLTPPPGGEGADRRERDVAREVTLDKHPIPSPQPPAFAGAGSTPPGGGSMNRGFRAFRLAASNFRVWDPAGSDAKSLEEQIVLHADNVNGAAASGALLYELILRAGLPVSARVVRVGLGESDPSLRSGRTEFEAFDVNGGELMVCVEEAITLPLMRQMIANKPKKIVCLDKAFAGDDAAKTNARLEAESHGVVFQTA
jgi:adenine-specific DNA-methyltransferase